MNYFDTAWTYHGGNSDLFLADALKKYPRESYLLANKLPTGNINCPEDVEKYFNLQLKNCQVDYFDFYLVHTLNEKKYDVMIQNLVYEQLLALKDAGKIRYLGFSFHDKPYLLEEITNAYKWDFAQIQLNYLDWEGLDAESLYEILTRKQLPIIVMGPIRGGTLSDLCLHPTTILKKARPGSSISSWALRYAASLPGIMTVLSGMSNMAQLDENLNTFTDFEPISDTERSLLAEVATFYRKSGYIACTGCKYCTPCPHNVDIPRIFSCYNHYNKKKNVRAFKAEYSTLPRRTQAHNCVSCGVCMPKCPQKLAIPNLLPAISAFAKVGDFG